MTSDLSHAYYDSVYIHSMCTKWCDIITLAPSYKCVATDFIKYTCADVSLSPVVNCLETP